MMARIEQLTQQVLNMQAAVAAATAVASQQSPSISSSSESTKDRAKLNTPSTVRRQGDKQRADLVDQCGVLPAGMSYTTRQMAAGSQHISYRISSGLVSLVRAINEWCDHMGFIQTCAHCSVSSSRQQPHRTGTVDGVEDALWRQGQEHLAVCQSLPPAGEPSQ